MSRPQGWSSFRNSRLLHVGAGRHQAGNAPFPPVAGMLTVAPCGGGVKGIVNPETPGGGIGDGRATMPALRPHRGRWRLLPALRRPHHGQGPHGALPRPVEERPTPGTGEAFSTTPFVQVARGCMTPLALPGSGTCSKHLNRDSAAAISAPSRLSLTCPFKPPSPTLQSSWRPPRCPHCRVDKKTNVL